MLTHQELCELASSIALQRGAVLVLGNRGRKERPDVFALFPDGSTCVYECKAGRYDFRADASKPFRKEPGKGMGSERVYLVNRDVCSPHEIPRGWKLLVATDLDSAEQVIPCPLESLKDQRRLYRMPCSRESELQLVAEALRDGVRNPRGFPVKVSKRPLADTLIQMARTGTLCMFCANGCRKDVMHCEAFRPDYRTVW